MSDVVDIPNKGVEGFDWYTEPARLRASDQLLADDLTRTPHPPAEGSPTRLVVTTIVTSYPTSTGQFFGVQPLTVTGTETEGSAGSTSSFGAGELFYALNVGTEVPPQNTVVLATFVSYRWVFQYDG